LLSEKKIKNLFGTLPPSPKYTPLFGDASDRNFIRMTTETEAKSKSCILMVYPEPNNNSLQDYIDTAELLKKYNLPVPEIYGVSSNDGVAALEDLGDITLQEAIVKNPERAQEYYKSALSILAKMQSQIKDADNKNAVAFARRFDDAKFIYELQFFRENYIEKFLGKKIKKTHLEALNNEFKRLSAFIAGHLPLVFTHRDYHSRNFMVSDDRIVMIDFQDARLGPPQYDLVSILRDSYVKLDDDFVKGMIESYFRYRKEYEFPVRDKDEFLVYYDYCALQRNLKAIGTFAFQKVGKGKNDYLKYIPLTFSYVKENRALASEFTSLGEILDIYVGF